MIKTVNLVSGDLKNTFEKILKLKLKGSTSIFFIRLIKKINKIIEDYSESRVQILKSYSKKDEKGNPIIENNEYKFENDEVLNTVIIEINKLLDIVHEELDGIVPEDIINSIDNIEPELILSLGDLVKYNK